MASKDKNAPWDPYETSHRREFFYRPCSRTPFTPPATSKTFRDCCSLSGHVGPSGYSEDFCWKAATKPECIRTGSASGQRRNNPHPSQKDGHMSTWAPQGFLTWRLPKGAVLSSAGGSTFPRSGHTSEEEIRKALRAQYCSTYRTDFLGLPQGADHMCSYGEAGLVPLHSRQQDPQCTRTEMRDNYCQPKRRELPQDNRCATALGGNARHRVHCRGIVPSVVQRHIRDQHNVSELTTYDAFFGKKASAVPYVLQSLQPQELQQLCKVLPEEDAELMKSLMRMATAEKDGKEVRLPAVRVPSSRPTEWISSWPGPH